MPGARRVIAGPGAALREPVFVADDFLPAELAVSMRGYIKAHFADPGERRADTHQVWNYWFVPELYTYLRTTPERIIRRVDRVMHEDPPPTRVGNAAG
jgi:hypothetical protein